MNENIYHFNWRITVSAFAFKPVKLLAITRRWLFSEPLSEFFMIILIYMQKKAVVQHLYLGRNPPLFTEMRVLSQCSDDDHVVDVLPIPHLYNRWGYGFSFQFCPNDYVMHAGTGVGNEFSHSRWHECNSCCETKEKTGIWNVGKVEYNRHACWRKGTDKYGTVILP